MKKLELKINFDPRTKILLLLMTVLTASITPTIIYTLVLVVGIALLGIFSGQWKFSIKGLVLYGLIYIFTIYALKTIDGSLRTMFYAFLGLFHRCYPCGMLFGVIMLTTKVNEFLAAMNKIHVPIKISIPFAIMIRYLPVIRQDWSYIKDAMKMRDVSPSLKGFIFKPMLTIECVYVPLLISASKATDELSVASITRGIENPSKRSCLVNPEIKFIDILTILIFTIILVLGFILKLGV